jgi:hypothetical protein
MPYVASNNGLSWRWHDPSENYQLAAGEVAFTNPPADTDLSAAFPGYAAALAIQQAPQQLAAVLAAGLIIGSTGTPAVDGTYPLDAGTLADITSVATAVAAGKGFFGLASVTFAQVNGTPYTFTDPTLFTNWASAIGAYVAQCTLTARAIGAGQTPTWPAATVTIP